MYEDYGIIIPNGRTTGQITTTCPNCSADRKKKSDKCLSINLDTGVWNCHHCGWAGGLKREKIERVQYVLPEWKNSTDISDKVVKWFEGRRISQSTLKKAKVTDSGKGEIEFNYFHDGQLKNIKYRTADKKFRLHAGSELILYNLDSIKESDEVWITEGEIDALSLIEAGINSVVSVPNGANPKSNNLSYLDGYMDLFNGKRIHLALDNDPPGRKLRNDLADRFGKFRCDYITFDELKDANEYLISNGSLKLRERCFKFENFPIEGVFTVGDLIDDIRDMYFYGLPNGPQTGMNAFDDLIRFVPGYITTITGIPGHGKSDFLDQVLIMLHRSAGWKGAYYSPENRPTQLHISKIARKMTGKKWFGHDRMTESELTEVLKILDYNFWFIKPEKDFTLKSILNSVAELRTRYGIDWFVIDAWNKLEHHYTESETKYIGQSLDEITMFCEQWQVHCFIVAHPTKMRKDKDSGLHEVPTLYDISGSANFFNKTDNGITVYRNMITNQTDVYIQKVKFQHWGKPGYTSFHYDLDSGRFLTNNLNTESWI